MTGALAITTMSMAPSFAADTDSTETSTPGVAEADEATTIIVQLAAGSVGDDRASAYKDIKQRIARSVSQASPGGTIGDVRDYHHALDGFAITAPASARGAIKSVQGVKDAFVDGQREPVFYPEMSGDGGAAVADPAKETRSDQVAGRGRGRVIEVIDASFDTSHEAFAGTMDTAALRLPQAEMESLTSQLDAGQGCAWVSDKIPFVYDYADRDTNPYIGYGYGPQDYTVHAHGTRMAALAAANGATYQGSAPDAQLILAKVLSNSTRTVRDSDLLAALDDAMVLKPDTVCVSFMANRDLGGGAEALYDDVFARLSSAGITVDAPAGDSGRAEWRTGVRDLGDVGAPATYSSVLAAPGGNVNAAIPGNDYRRMPGTGEASARVAGVAALVRQRMATDPMFAGMSDEDKSALVYNFLMGTAHPIVDTSAADGTFWSPRWVGAGTVDAQAATTSSVYPSVVGASDPSRPKAELGESASGWTFQVQLTNLSDTAHTYTLGGQVLSEKVNGLLYAKHSTNWAGKGIDLTIPYLGFYGSADETPIFGTPVYGEGMIGTSTMTFRGLTLGQLNPFDLEEAAAISANDRHLYIISRSTEENARTYVTPATVLLRDVMSLTYTYRNEAGDVVRSYTFGGAPKSRTVSNGRYSEASTEEAACGSKPLFDGYDEQGRALADGRYALTIEGTTGGASPRTERLTHVVTLDTAPSVISNVEILGEGDERKLSFDATDSSPIAAYGFSWSADGEPFMREKFYDSDERGDDGRHYGHFEVPLSQIAERSGADPSTVYLQVWDWPVNKGTLKVDLKPVPMTSLALSQTDVTLSVGDSVTLSATHEPADASATDVAWSSSNEAVATVSQDGTVTAVGAGDATVTVYDPTQPSLVSASATIHVSAPSPARKAGAWKRNGRGWWYRYEDGSYPSGESAVIDGNVYRFDASGYMRTGWVLDGGQWYYHAASGAQASGWLLSGVRWYYLSPQCGVMVTGWVKVGSAWYYLAPANGAMVTGWLKEGGHWYYLKSASGAMATGRLRIWGTRYHFADNGQLIA